MDIIIGSRGSKLALAQSEEVKRHIEALNSDYVIVMNQGKIYKAGKPSEVFSDTNGLLKIGLDIPFTYKIKEELRQYGIKVGEYKDIEGLVEALWQLNSKR